MRLTCPNCQATYDVPAQVLTAGRKLRCAQCRVAWWPQGPVPDAAAPSSAVPAPAPKVRPPVPAQPSAMRKDVAAAWVFSLVLLGAMGWSAIAWRHPIMMAWPPSQRAYAAIGLH